MPAATDIRNAVGAALRAAADPDRAPQQQAYMKSEMPFLGVLVPQCRRIAAAAFRAHPLPDAGAWQAAILGLWREARFREERYAAVELLNLPRCSRWIEPRRVPLIEELVVTGAWWDYVDAIAGRAMGTMLAAHARPTKTLLRRWARSDNVWKRRSAILAQLRSKQATDRKLLADVIWPVLRVPTRRDRAEATPGGGNSVRPAREPHQVVGGGAGLHDPAGLAKPRRDPCLLAQRRTDHHASFALFEVTAVRGSSPMRRILDRYQGDSLP